MFLRYLIEESFLEWDDHPRSLSHQLVLGRLEKGRRLLASKNILPEEERPLVCVKIFEDLIYLRQKKQAFYYLSEALGVLESLGKRGLFRISAQRFQYAEVLEASSAQYRLTQGQEGIAQARQFLNLACLQWTLCGELSHAERLRQEASRL